MVHCPSLRHRFVKKILLSWKHLVILMMGMGVHNDDDLIVDMKAFSLRQSIFCPFYGIQILPIIVNNRFQVCYDLIDTKALSLSLDKMNNDIKLRFLSTGQFQ